MLKKIKNWIYKDYIRKCEVTHTFKQSEMYKLRIEQLIVQQTQKESWLVDPEYVFAVSKTGLVQLNGQQITSLELKNLKSEVRALKDFSIWKIVLATLREKAIEKAVLTSTDLYSLKGNEQVLAGKMMIYNLDIIKTIIDKIEKAK